MLSHKEFSTRVEALEACAEKGVAAAKKVLKAAARKDNGGRPLKTVIQSERGGGYDLTIRMRPTMTESQIEEAGEALRQALEDLKKVSQEASGSEEE